MSDGVKQYPECERWAAVHPQAQVIAEFLEWLTFEDIELSCRRDVLIARYLGVDLDALEAERRAMLEAVQSANES